MLYFRKKVTANRFLFVYLQRNYKEYSYAYQIRRKKLPRFRQ